tara:strand:- start:263 stop:970 length:708 start_codon:yes stop_codon:yes gene_type:complete
MNFIMEQMTGLSLSSKTVGCLDRMYLSKDIRAFINRTLRIKLATQNTENGTAELFSHADVIDNLIKDGQGKTAIVPDADAGSKSSVRGFMERAPYDSDFKRSLKPSISRGDNDVEPVIVPPQVQNDEIRITNVLAESVLFKDFSFLEPPTFDHVIIFDVPDGAFTFTPVDIIACGTNALEFAPVIGIGGAADFGGNAGVFQLKESLKQIYKYTRLDVIHPKVLSKIVTFQQAPMA